MRKSFVNCLVFAAVGSIAVYAQPSGVIYEGARLIIGDASPPIEGGTFVVHRRQINGETWKTDVIDVHLAGKLLLLKSFCKDQRETRSDFRPVPGELTLAQAKEMLDAAANEIAQMRLLPATLATAR